MQLAWVHEPSTWKTTNRQWLELWQVHWETAHTTAEQKDVTGSLVKLRATTKQEAIRVVQRLRRNLGHPPAKELTELLASRGVRAASSYVCMACAKYKKPAEAAPAALPKTTSFNHIVQADVFFVRLDSQKYAIMSIVDLATRYTAAILIRNEQSEEYVKALERVWI